MTSDEVAVLAARITSLETKVETLNVGPRLTFLERAVWIALGGTLVTGGATLAGVVTKALGG